MQHRKTIVAIIITLSLLSACGKEENKVQMSKTENTGMKVEKAK